MKIRKSVLKKLQLLNFPFNVYVLADGYKYLSVGEGYVWSTFSKEQLEQILLMSIPGGIAEDCAKLFYSAKEKPMSLAVYISTGEIQTPWIHPMVANDVMSGMALFQDGMAGIDGWAMIEQYRKRVKTLSLAECESYYFHSMRYRLFECAYEALEQAQKVIGTLW